MTLNCIYGDELSHNCLLLGRELEVGYESDEDMDLNLLFRESDNDEAELDPEENLDHYWEDERSGRSSGQHNSATGTSTDTQRVGLAPAVSASEAHLGERSDHPTENNPYPPSARVDQRKRKRGTGRAGTKIVSQARPSHSAAFSSFRINTRREGLAHCLCPFGSIIS